MPYNGLQVQKSWLPGWIHPLRYTSSLGFSRTHFSSILSKMSRSSEIESKDDSIPKLVDELKGKLRMESTEKRDLLCEAERRIQLEWAKQRIFEVNPPLQYTTTLPKQKFFGTMAFPYMNGRLHVGHAFTWSKVEFMAGWARMLNRQALLPLGFHCTGMPIKACADKLVLEMQQFGQDFAQFTNVSEPSDLDINPSQDIINSSTHSPISTSNSPGSLNQTNVRSDITKFSTRKSKTVAKTGGARYQFQIMESLGIPRHEIFKFGDAKYWLDYFPRLTQQDLSEMGSRVDWRRSFVTTDRNPYFDSFVRWQMNKLREAGKIKFGKRYTVYSPLDGQACLDHDRSSGEGITIQEYTAIKLRVLEWAPNAIAALSKLPDTEKCKAVYFIAATLRPETMYGQTACFVGKDIVYGLYKARDGGLYVISEHAARNLAYQDILERWGEFTCVAQITGDNIIGTLVNAPLSVHSSGIRILPMLNIKDTKGTAVVTCVPSDSPDDVAMIMELRRKPEFYGINPEWANLDILPIINTPSWGNLTAVALVDSMKISSPRDLKQLAEAKDIAYKEGFYQGKMIYGDYLGMPVQEAKIQAKGKLISQGDAFVYAEPDGEVISRSGDVCVAALLDQWYLNYGRGETGGDDEWYSQVRDWIANDGVNTFSLESKRQFEQTLSWLSQWACARSYGLGTKLPWDESFLVESLSDSTMYMAYYTIAHYLHGDLFGNTPGLANVAPGDLTDEVWDYLFARRNTIPEACTIDRNMLQQMRSEFEYWYPMDYRVSGKDLVQNHLTFCLYTHAALLDEKFWPRGIRVNGHLLLNGEKMSKSSGNFLTLHEALKKFGADATRIALADAGDSIEDANFEESVANASILRLYELRKWMEESLCGVDVHQECILGVELNKRSEEVGEKFFDGVFMNDLREIVRDTRRYYDEGNFKAALKRGFYDAMGARDAYREACRSAGIDMSTGLIWLYVKVQSLCLAPIAPHFSEYVWKDILKQSTSVQYTEFVKMGTRDEEAQQNLAGKECILGEFDERISRLAGYMRATAGNILAAEGAHGKRIARLKKKAGGNNGKGGYDPGLKKRLYILVADAEPLWQQECLRIARECISEVEIEKEGAKNTFTIDMKKAIQRIPAAQRKRGSAYMQTLKRRVENDNITLEREISLEDELRVVELMKNALAKAVQRCTEVKVLRVSPEGKVLTQEGEQDEFPVEVIESAGPGDPGFYFENV